MIRAVAAKTPNGDVSDSQLNGGCDNFCHTPEINEGAPLDPNTVINMVTPNNSNSLIT